MTENGDNVDINQAADEAREIPSPIHVITIVLDEDNGLPPKVDLGDISPLVAYTIFQSILDTLYDCIPTPQIKWDGITLMEYDDFDFAGDDDDEDYT